MKHEHINEIKAILILAFGFILLASLVSFSPEDLPWYTSHPNTPYKNWIGVVGAYVAGGLFFVLGYASYAGVVLLIFLGWNKFVSRELRFSGKKLASFVVFFCVLGALFSLTGTDASTARFNRGGIIGLIISDFLVKYCYRTGAYIILMTLATLTLIVVGEFLVSPLVFRLIDAAKAAFKIRTIKSPLKAPRIAGAIKPIVKSEAVSKISSKIAERTKAWLEAKEKAKPVIKNIKPEADKVPPAKPLVSAQKPAAAVPAASQDKPKIRIIEPVQDENKGPVPAEPKLRVEENYELPSVDLLDDPAPVSTSKIHTDLEEGARILKETLSDFNVSVHVADIERGPVITRYELEPAPGVKVQRITTLADDIALAMKAPSVRIVAPIPGKNRVGIEVPNGATASVYLKEVLTHSAYRNASSKLTLAIGKDIAGQPIVADLTEMPHLLIAGTTGSGKTVCVNSLIMSLLYHCSPSEVKFIMVDPKMVELTQYNGLPHCLCPAVTDYKKVSAALNWIVSEMEQRYATLSKEGVRNIKGYHAKGYEMPYIVLIIDELADLMQVAAKTIESAITRLAQLSRAVGIHLVLATQRPSVDVITGVIKANFPSRISFKVASKVDSRTVLDMNGAENLLGRGDLLFIKPGDAKPTRGQCCYVNDAEIQRVIESIKKQKQPEYNEAVLKHQPVSASANSDEDDELYEEAVNLILEMNQASVSVLQRRMRLGYSRAARLVDMMEQKGLVGPYCGSKPRDILVDREEWLLRKAKKDDGSEQQPSA